MKCDLIFYATYTPMLQTLAKSIPIPDEKNWFTHSPLKAEHCDHPVGADERHYYVMGLCDGGSCSHHIAFFIHHSFRVAGGCCATRKHGLNYTLRIILMRTHVFTRANTRGARL